MADGTMTGRRPMRHAGRVATHVVLIIGAIVMVGPFVWQLLTSLKAFSETTRVPPTFLPDRWEWSNYLQVFDLLPLGDMFRNTVLMTAGRTLAQLAFCSLAAYAFARLRFRGNNLLFGLFLSVLMVPSQLFLIPQYVIVQDLGWVNTLPGLIVPGMFSAFGTFLLRQFFLALPRDMEEAARLDGANPLQVFWHVALPLARPGLLALTILTALWSWNDFMYPLVVTTDPAKMPLSAGLGTLQGEHFTDYSILMAGSALATAPMVVAFILLQRHFIQGIAFTGSKG
ncbi:carbohydrate ABC transporter permease [Micromonospora sp. DR5-3]|uniref:carbohydrate ABC transporter permease n=1 Tax=unclassified Micromonospora TaxID=2617518 RepID=UPI0011D518A6|nr:MULTISPECIES: carbohydrate ABC transporter permease [unclassified Micromonospora]MCW3816016.1 carbohydrate ABC transporter permease [Micromonospora sp. DR5-3]TYC20346.1 carbohydrate ABC transporter permease [Micromonospora sp. MP36]